MAEDQTNTEEQPVDGVDGEATAEGDAAAEGQKKFGTKQIILFIVLPILIIAGAATGAYVMGYLGGHKGELVCDGITEKDVDYEACQAQLATTADGEAPGIFIDIPDMIVNLNSTSKQPRFLKISLKVEIEKQDQQEGFTAAMPRVIDQFQTYLRELQIEDLRGSSGMYRMKIELLNRVRAAAPSTVIKDVLFQEILIQ